VTQLCSWPTKQCTCLLHARPATVDDDADDLAVAVIHPAQLLLSLPPPLLLLATRPCSYDDEWDTYENGVNATTRGRGPAEAGQINIVD
jgi:hypothetical protein